LYFGALKRETRRGTTASIVVITPRYSKETTGKESGWAILTMALHDTQEFYNDLGGWSDEHLALATALGIDDVVLQKEISRIISSHGTT
jgi:hypothetical protein